MKEFIQFTGFIALLGVLLVSFVAVVSLPFAYMQGSAKSEYLLEAKGIEMHWYKASFLPDNVLLDVKLRN